MKRLLTRLAILAALGVILAGCIASPTTRTDSRTDSHDTTSATTQTQTQEQDGNRPVCVAFLNIGSCNQTQSGVQSGASDLTPAQPATATRTLEPGTFILFAAGAIFGFMWLCIVVVAIFAPRD